MILFCLELNYCLVSRKDLVLFAFFISSLLNVCMRVDPPDQAIFYYWDFPSLVVHMLSFPKCLWLPFESLLAQHTYPVYSN